MNISRPDLRGTILSGIFVVFLMLFSGCDEINVKSSVGESLRPASDQATPSKDNLTILTWGEYFSPQVIESFEKESKTKVEFVEFTNLDEMQALLQSRPADFDLIVVDGGTLADLIELQLISPIDRTRIPNFSNLDPKFQGLPFDPENTFSVPYMWGTTLLAFRSDKVDDPEESWNLLWNQSLKGRVLMLDDEFDVYAAALLADGKDINTSDPDELEGATQRLIRQVDQLGTRFVDIFTIRDALISGECWASMTYSSDAAVLAEDCEDISYFIPEEGAPLWLDSFVIPKEAQNQEAAHRFLEFLCRPEVAAANSNDLWCASANRAAKPFLSKEVLDDPTLYLSDEQLARCQFDTQSSPERQRIVNQGLKRVFDRVREVDGKPQVSVLIWEEYLAPGIAEEFEKESGARIVLTEVENSERLKQELAAAPERFDVVVADEQSLRELISLRLVRPLDKTETSGVASLVDPRVASPVDPDFSYSVPYLWGLTVLAGRKEVLHDLPASWDLLWRKDLRIGILDEPGDMVWLSLLALGHDPNESTEAEIEEATRKLSSRFPEFADQMIDLFTGLDDLEAGKLDLVVTYNGDALTRAMENPDIQVVLPEEGAPLWIDSFAVSRDAPNPALAYEFIRFMGKGKVSAESSNQLRYASPNLEARGDISPELLTNPVLYPDADTLAKCRFVRFPAELERSVHQAISRLVSGGRASGADSADGREERSSIGRLVEATPVFHGELNLK